jgi:catechol 2,3-dioxygenase-like lactoylglutathione lyase family enzyme
MERTMQMKLELLPVPVSDIDQAKAFYTEKLGFTVDVDVAPTDSVRIVQLTPPGSACSIGLWAGLPEAAEMQPGSARGLHLVVADVAQAREELHGRGVDVGEIENHPQGVKYARFADPDGNSWVFQEMPWRASDFE